MIKLIRKAAFILSVFSLILFAVSCAASVIPEDGNKETENSITKEKDYLVPSKLTFTSDFQFSEEDDLISTTFTVSCDGTQWKTDYSAFIYPDEDVENSIDEVTDTTLTWYKNNILYIDFDEMIFTIDLKNKTFSTVFHTMDNMDKKDSFINPVFKYTTYKDENDTEGNTVTLKMTAIKAENKPAIVDINFKLFDQDYNMKIDYNQKVDDEHYTLIEYNGITGLPIDDYIYAEISKKSAFISFIAKDEKEYKLYMKDKEMWIVSNANYPAKDMFENVSDFSVSVGDFVLPIKLVNLK